MAWQHCWVCSTYMSSNSTTLSRHKILYVKGCRDVKSYISKVVELASHICRVTWPPLDIYVEGCRATRQLCRDVLTVMLKWSSYSWLSRCLDKVVELLNIYVKVTRQPLDIYVELAWHICWVARYTRFYVSTRLSSCSTYISSGLTTSRNICRVAW